MNSIRGDQWEGFYAKRVRMRFLDPTGTTMGEGQMSVYRMLLLRNDVPNDIRIIVVIPILLMAKTIIHTTTKVYLLFVNIYRSERNQSWFVENILIEI